MQPKFHEYRTDHAAFTLVEMMVVMIILSILVTILFPVVFRSRERAQRRQAQAEANRVILAVKAYQNVFGHLPAQVDARDIWYFTNNHEVIRPLMGHNPRNRSFISIETNYLDSKTNFLDPAGTPYLICIDQDGNSRQIITNLLNVTYNHERADETRTYSLGQLDIKVAIGVGAFMKNTTNLSVNSWSDF